MHELADNEIIEFAANNLSPNNSYFYILYLGQKEQVEYCRNDESKETFSQKLQELQQNAEQILIQCKEGLENIHKTFLSKRQTNEEQFAKDMHAYEVQVEEDKKAYALKEQEAERKNKQLNTLSICKTIAKTLLFAAILLTLFSWILFSVICASQWLTGNSSSFPIWFTPITGLQYLVFLVGAPVAFCIYRIKVKYGRLISSILLAVVLFCVLVSIIPYAAPIARDNQALAFILGLPDAFVPAVCTFFALKKLVPILLKKQGAKAIPLLPFMPSVKMPVHVDYDELEAQEIQKELELCEKEIHGLAHKAQVAWLQSMEPQLREMTRARLEQAKEETLQDIKSIEAAHLEVSHKNLQASLGLLSLSEKIAFNSEQIMHDTSNINQSVEHIEDDFDQALEDLEKIKNNTAKTAHAAEATARKMSW